MMGIYSTSRCHPLFQFMHLYLYGKNGVDMNFVKKRNKSYDVETSASVFPLTPSDLFVESVLCVI